MSVFPNNRDAASALAAVIVFYVLLGVLAAALYPPLIPKMRVKVIGPAYDAAPKPRVQKSQKTDGPAPSGRRPAFWDVTRPDASGSPAAATVDMPVSSNKPIPARRPGPAGSGWPAMPFGKEPLILSPLPSDKSAAEFASKRSPSSVGGGSPSSAASLAGIPLIQSAPSRGRLVPGGNGGGAGAAPSSASGFFVPAGDGGGAGGMGKSKEIPGGGIGQGRSKQTDGQNPASWGQGRDGAGGGSDSESSTGGGNLLSGSVTPMVGTGGDAGREEGARGSGGGSRPDGTGFSVEDLSMGSGVIQLGSGRGFPAPSGTGGRNLVHHPHPAIPPWFEKKGIESVGLFRVLIAPSGRIESVDVEKTTGFREIDLLWKNAVAEWKYHPAETWDTRYIRVRVNLD